MVLLGTSQEPDDAVAWLPTLTVDPEAVRIPRELELDAEEATIRREGDRLILEPVRTEGLLAVLARSKPLDEPTP